MPKKLKLLTKTPVSGKVVAVAVGLAVIIGVGYAASQFLPGTGEDDSKGFLPSTPPLGCCEARNNFITDQSTCEKERRYDMWCPLQQTTVYDNNGKVVTGDQVAEGYTCSGCGCPVGTTECGDYCCTQGQEWTSTCGKQYCTAKSCPSQYPKLCDAKDRDTCCKADETCGKKTVGVLMCTGEIAVCIPPNSNNPCPSGTKDCGTTSDKKTVCCPFDNACGNISGIPFCIPSSCSAGEDLCRGGGVQRCCPAGTCRYSPGTGRPFCDIRW